MEQWKQIVIDDEEYNYSISNEGNVRNDKTGRILKKQKDKNGYELVNLYKNGKMKTVYVHRLVAEAFIPNTDNKPCIDHINCVRDENRVENLKWCTHKENINNPLTLEKKQGENNPKSTKVICITTGNVYGSTYEAERQTGVTTQIFLNVVTEI